MNNVRSDSISRARTRNIDEQPHAKASGKLTVNSKTTTRSNNSIIAVSEKYIQMIKGKRSMKRYVKQSKKED